MQWILKKLLQSVAVKICYRVRQKFCTKCISIAKWAYIYLKVHLLLQSEAEFILQSTTRICHKVRKELHSWTEILSQSTLVIKNLLQSVLGTEKLFKNLLQSVLITTKWETQKYYRVC